MVREEKKVKVTHKQFLVEECSEEYMQELVAFLSKWLRGSDQPVISKEYPLLFNDSPLVKHFIIRNDNGEIISHAGAIVRYIVSGTARLRFGMISNVFTRPDYRNNGLATKVVLKAVEFLEESQCALAILWTDQEKFYSKLKFRRMGKEWIFKLFKEKLNDNVPEPRFYTEELLPDIMAVYNRKPLRVERTVKEMKRLLEIPNMKTYVYIGPSGKTEAYACLGKGYDFKGVIHEICGEPRAMEILLSGIVKKENKPLPLVLSPQEEKLGKSLMEKGIQCFEGALGFCRVLNEEAIKVFASHLGPLAQRYIGQNPYLPFHLGGLDSV